YDNELESKKQRILSGSDSLIVSLRLRVGACAEQQLPSLRCRSMAIFGSFFPLTNVFCRGN
ncbi:MAG TPA: hypothetical protein PLX69_18615, partial [Leptospiraceae bacterium]|nr:hypothetical protein [Leptospiraceae bacterium]